MAEEHEFSPAEEALLGGIADHLAAVDSAEQAVRAALDRLQAPALEEAFRSPSKQALLVACLEAIGTATTCAEAVVVVLRSLAEMIHDSEENTAQAWATVEQARTVAGRVSDEGGIIGQQLAESLRAMFDAPEATP